MIFKLEALFAPLRPSTPCTRPHDPGEDCAGCVADAGGDLRAYFARALGHELPPPNPAAKNVIWR